MMTSFYPAEFFHRSADRLANSRDIRREPYGTWPRNCISARWAIATGSRFAAPNGTEADLFGLSPDGRVPMYVIFRTAFDSNGQPTRLTIAVYPADRNQFIYDFGEVPGAPEPAERGRPRTLASFARAQLVPGRCSCSTRAHVVRSR
jgi:hypothetical protein